MSAWPTISRRRRIFRRRPESVFFPPGRPRRGRNRRPKSSRSRHSSSRTPLPSCWPIGPTPKAIPACWGAARVRANAPVALRLAEWLIDEGQKLPAAEANQLVLDRLPELFATRDAYEGLSAAGKRQAMFRGCSRLLRRHAG